MRWPRLRWATGRHERSHFTCSDWWRNSLRGTVRALRFCPGWQRRNAIFLQYTAPIYVAIIGAVSGAAADPIDCGSRGGAGWILFFRIANNVRILGNIVALASALAFASVGRLFTKERTGSPSNSVILGTS